MYGTSAAILWAVGKRNDRGISGTVTRDGIQFIASEKVIAKVMRKIQAQQALGMQGYSCKLKIRL